MVGNVGVRMTSLSFEGLIDTLGIRDQTITSGKMKDAGNPLRDMNAEERAIYQDIVGTLYEDFIAKVKKHRPVTADDLKIIGDGRIMTAKSALQYHLIDEIGYYETALKAAESTAKIQNPTVIVYRREGENTGGFYSWPQRQRLRLSQRQKLNPRPLGAPLGLKGGQTFLPGASPVQAGRWRAHHHLLRSVKMLSESRQGAGGTPISN